MRIARHKESAEEGEMNRATFVRRNEYEWNDVIEIVKANSHMRVFVFDNGTAREKQFGGEKIDAFQLITLVVNLPTLSLYVNALLLWRVVLTFLFVPSHIINDENKSNKQDDNNCAGVALHHMAINQRLKSEMHQHIWTRKSENLRRSIWKIDCSFWHTSFFNWIV